MSEVIKGNIGSIKTAFTFREKDIVDPTPEPSVSKYHYRLTTILLFASCLLVTSTYWIAGL